MPYNYSYVRDGRFGGFFVPFILGGLAGSAAVGVTRPRPIIANPGPYPGYYPGNNLGSQFGPYPPRPFPVPYNY